MLAPVPRIEYAFHCLVRRIHCFITSQPYDEETDDTVISPYTQEIKNALDEMADIEGQACEKMAYYEAKMREVLFLLDTEKEELKAIFENKEQDEETRTYCRAKYDFDMGLRNLVNSYQLRTLAFLDGMMEAHPNSVEELDRLVRRYARKIKADEDISE